MLFLKEKNLLRFANVKGCGNGSVYWQHFEMFCLKDAFKVFSFLCIYLHSPSFKTFSQGFWELEIWGLGLRGARGGRGSSSKDLQ